MIIIGLIIAFIAFYFGIPQIEVNLGTYIQKEAFFLVLGGTIAATLVSSSYENVKRLTVALRIHFLPKALSGKQVLTPTDAVNRLVHIAELAQRRSIQDLINEGKGVGDGFLDRALGLLGTGLEKEFIKAAMETDIEEATKRHLGAVSLIRHMGTYAPLFGMTGTVMGIVQVLKNVTDVDNIVVGMSLALLTTLYGLVLTAIVFIPLSNRLRHIAYEQKLTKEIIKSGILSIYDKEIPLKVKTSLTAYLDSKQKNNVI